MGRLLPKTLWVATVVILCLSSSLAATGSDIDFKGRLDWQLSTQGPATTAPDYAFVDNNHPVLGPLTLATALPAQAAAPTEGAAPADENRPSIFKRAAISLERTAKEGDWELYVPLYTYHMRYAYTAEKISSYNENPWGLGLGRGRIDEKGNWHGLYAMFFHDSHNKPEYQLGYAFKTFWPIAENLKAGLGYTAFLGARSDINNYIPFLGVLPVASLEYGKVSLDATYVPGGQGNGNVMFIWSKIRF